MDAASLPTSGQRGFHGLGRAGFALVSFVALVTSLNTTAKHLVTYPVDEWFVEFVLHYGAHLVIGVPMLLAVVWARNRFPARGARQYVIAFVAVVAATEAGLLVLHGLDQGWEFVIEDPPWMLLDTILETVPDVVRYGFVGLIIASTWLYLRTEADHVSALEQVAVDSARMDQQTAEARLQMLEAQIEPHFLFNTLANVKRLYETDRAVGVRMLDNLKDYLAIALPQMRESESTLGREVDHAKSYLDIQQIRMAHRLAYTIDVPEGLRAARFPGLMLVTLVENAIKHGLGPLPEGGRIDVTASLADSSLRLQVADNGQGFVRSGGGGTGLANIRARLSSRFGTAASLSLALNVPSGVIATIVLPCEPVVATQRP